jgi:hypothetical protein
MCSNFSLFRNAAAALPQLREPARRQDTGTPESAFEVYEAANAGRAIVN